MPEAFVMTSMNDTPDPSEPMSGAVLNVRDLAVHYKTDDGTVPAVNGVSFDLMPGETYAIVGESGSGKSTVALALLALAPVVGGGVRLAGRDIAAMGRTELRRLRGREIAMIFQEPMTSLNPVLTLGYQLVETIRLHQPLDKSAARQRAAEMLAKVGISDPARRLDQHPHELSGGMRQRVMIAMALSCNPRVLVADEPTTALDVTVQAQILSLLDQLRAELGTAILLITHDIGVVAETADRIGVMYAGQLIEQATARDLFETPLHPYTRGLLASVPRVDLPPAGGPLAALAGTPPRPGNAPPGCPFRPRCADAMEHCTTMPPEVLRGRHSVRCWLHAR
ncbi:ABC transporter ATP-binding protein [Roseinatronobacter sp.]|uniref:ABC transporter ATP-binding protein n=1 Tax=Roseinatronobacter sp. TaxID=1945755 RepID=UPI003F6E8EAB